VVADFHRNEVRRKFDALLGEPGDVPQIAVFDAVLAECDRDDLVGEDFLAALRLKNEAGGAKIDAIQILRTLPSSARVRRRKPLPPVKTRSSLSRDEP
jgi:hypothetical protein